MDANETAPDIETAKAELEKWKKLDADKAEKINGKWVGGEDRKKLIAKVKELLKESDEMMQSKQTLKAVGKLQEAVRLYPNNWEANFELGFFYFVRPGGRDLERAGEYFEQAARQADAPAQAARFAAFSHQNAGNLAVAYELWGEVAQSSPNRYLREMAHVQMERIREALAEGRVELAVRKLGVPTVRLQGSGIPPRK